MFAFLTTGPNGGVFTVHPKAMPMILTTADEQDQWMTAPTPEAMKLQRPLPDLSLRAGDGGSGVLTLHPTEHLADLPPSPPQMASQQDSNGAPGTPSRRQINV